MTWNARSAESFSQPDRIAQIADALHAHHVDIMANQAIRFPSIHIRGFVTVPFYFVKGSQGTTLLVSETLSLKKNSRLTRLLNKVKGVESQVIDIDIQSGYPLSTGAF
jgi:hypothetical protein